MMSGVASIVFTGVTPFVSGNLAKTGFFILGAACFFVAAYLAWKAERLRVVTLEEKLKPRAGLEVTGRCCIVANTNEMAKQNWIELFRNIGNVKLTNCQIQISASGNSYVVTEPFDIRPAEQLPRGFVYSFMNEHSHLPAEIKEYQLIDRHWQLLPHAVLLHHPAHEIKITLLADNSAPAAVSALLSYNGKGWSVANC